MKKKSREMRILFLSNHDTCIYNIRLEILMALMESGHEVIISSPNGTKIEALKALGCSYIETEFNNRATSIKEDLLLIRQYRKVIRTTQPDVVLTYMIKPNIYGGIAARKEKIPVIANITGLGTALHNKGLSQKVIITLYRFAFKKVHLVFFQNEGNFNFFKQKRIICERGKLLPGSGVNLVKFSPLPYPDDKVVNFVFIARIMKDKGIDHYLEAAKVIGAEDKNAKFYLCGTCDDAYVEILNKYQAAGIIAYLGVVEDIRDIYKMMHCTVLPSYHEGLSNVLLESAACARPNITTNVNGCKEVVENGITGIIVEAKSTQSLISGIRRFLTLNRDKREKMGKNGRLKVEKEFDRQVVVNAYLEAVSTINQIRKN